MCDLDYTEYRTPTGYTVGLAMTHRRDSMGKERMSYYLKGKDRQTIFEGDDLFASPCHACDGPEMAAALLSFLTLKPGDTDDDYFKAYTPEQLAWCQSIEAEDLSSFAMDFENGEAQKYWDGVAPEWLDM